MAMYTLRNMPLSAIRSGYFHQLRNYLGGNSSIKLLQVHTGVTHVKVVEALSATRLQGWYRKQHSSKLCNINLKIHSRTFGAGTSRDNSYIKDSKPIQCYNGEEKIADNQSMNRLATLLVFDTETTGLNRQNDRIIELAIRDLSGGKDSTLITYINPGIDVTNSDIHGISNDMVNRKDVPRFQEVIPVLLQFVKSRQIDGKPVLLFAHNGRSFDVPFIINEFKRCSVEVPDDWIFVDTLPIARQSLNPDGSKHFNLEALRVRYEIPSEGPAHRAMQDVRVRYEIPSEGPAHRAMQDVMTLSYVLQRLTFDLKLTIPELIARGFRASDIKNITQKKVTR